MRVVVVGGGVLGTMHVWFALRRGHDVVQLEREPAARGASVRNFGLLWVSGRAEGLELDTALRGRELWEQIGGQVPELGFRAAGSLTVVRTEAELAVAKAATALPTADVRGFELLDSAGVRAVNPALRAGDCRNHDDRGQSVTIKLAVLDMAGTTVVDDGAVEAAFSAAPHLSCTTEAGGRVAVTLLERQVLLA